MTVVTASPKLVGMMALLCSVLRTPGFVGREYPESKDPRSLGSLLEFKIYF